MFYYYIYSIYIYLYKYIHKYLTCTTNFERGGRENPKDLMRTCGGGGRWDRVRKPNAAHCEHTGSSLFCSCCFRFTHTCTRTHSLLRGGGRKAFLSLPSKGSCYSWTCCLGSSAACCWTDCADQDRPAGEKTQSAGSITFFETCDSICFTIR